MDAKGGMYTVGKSVLFGDYQEYKESHIFIPTCAVKQELSMHGETLTITVTVDPEWSSEKISEIVKQQLERRKNGLHL